MQIVATGRFPAKAHHAFDYLTPLPSQCTFMEPAKGLYELLARIERENDVWLDFAQCFPMADFPECRMTGICYAANPQSAQAALGRLVKAVEEAEKDYVLTTVHSDRSHLTS